MDIELLRRRVAQRGMRLLTGTGAGTAATDTLPAQGIFRILICRISHSLGNTLLITPLVQEIEAIWPGAEIDIVTRSAAAFEIFSSYDSVRHIYCLPRQVLRHPLQLLRGLRGMQRTQYDLAIDTDPRSQTGRALLLRSRARYKLGFAGERKSGTISHGVDPAGAPRHNGQFPVYLLRAALGRHVDAACPPLSLRLTRSEQEQGRATLDRLLAQARAATGKRGVIGIFANATGPKLLPREWWRTFMPVIQSHFVDFSIIEIVPMSGESMLDDRYPAYYSTSIRKLGKLLSQLSMLICLDCGIMHLARASGTPTTAIFTLAGMIDEWAPYGDDAFVVNGEHLPPEDVAQRLIAQVPAAAFRVVHA
jgi:ADP-heptose:LPS heptosyltransferase